jgi:hypothetical protein
MRKKRGSRASPGSPRESASRTGGKAGLTAWWAANAAARLGPRSLLRRVHALLLRLLLRQRRRALRLWRRLPHLVLPGLLLLQLILPCLLLQLILPRLLRLQLILARLKLLPLQLLAHLELLLTRLLLLMRLLLAQLELAALLRRCHGIGGRRARCARRHLAARRRNDGAPDPLIRRQRGGGRRRQRLGARARQRPPRSKARRRRLARHGRRRAERIALPGTRQRRGPDGRRAL